MPPELFNPRFERLSPTLYLLTSECGGHTILSPSEYIDLIGGHPSKSLLKLLEARGIALTNETRQRLVNQYRLCKRQIFNAPSLHIVVPTNRCGLGCIYCHSPVAPENAIGEDMDKGTAERVVDFIFKSPSKTLTIEFQGGEPLLNFDIVRHIVRYAKRLNRQKKRGLKFTIVTNMVHMSKERLDFLAREEVWPCTSLDGPQWLHDLQRGKSYYALARWIPEVQERLDNRLSAIAVATRHSLGHGKEIVEEYLKFRLRRIWLQPFHRLGRGQKNAKGLGMSAEEYFALWKGVVEYIIENKKPIKEVMASFLTRKGIFGENPLFLDLQSPCGAAINQLAYDPKGDIYACDAGRMVGSELFRMGNVNEDYAKVMSPERVGAIVRCSLNELLHCKRCAFKPFCGVCPVLNYAATGSPVSWGMGFECGVLKRQFRFIFLSYYTRPKYRDALARWAKTKDL